MSFGDLTCLGIVLFDVVLSEYQPPHEIPGLDCLDSRGLDQVPTHHVHPLDDLLMVDGKL